MCIYIHIYTHINSTVQFKSLIPDNHDGSIQYDEPIEPLLAPGLCSAALLIQRVRFFSACRMRNHGARIGSIALN